VTLFFDKHFAQQMAAALRAVGIDARHVDDAFPPEEYESVPDTTWIPVVAANRWVAVTRDRAIKRNEPEALALLKSGATVLFVSEKLFSGRDAPDQLLWVLQHRKRLIAYVVARPYGTCFSVDHKGGISVTEIRPRRKR
jgi:hypothetical protein